MSSNSPGTGTLFAIVGPSGSGKDTVIKWLQEKLSASGNVLFVRRVVTRTADERHEDHSTMTGQEFADAERQGAFAVTWDAHDLRYGIPMSVQDHLKAGGIAVANGSRRALEDLHASFNNLCVINLTVDPDTLAARLSARNRSSDTNIKTRIAQAQLPFNSALGVIHIDNTGPVENAGQAILKLIKERRNNRPI